MTKQKRKRVARVVEILAVGLVAMDAVLYFAVVQPLRSKAQESFANLDNERAQLRNEEARVRRLEWYQASVPGTAKEVDDFIGGQVHGRRKSFTRLAQLLRGLADRTAVNLEDFSFKPEGSSARGNEPLEHIGVGVDLAGAFPNLMDYAHSLETTKGDFIVVHDFNFDVKDKEKGTGGNLELRLTADLYLTQ